MEQGVLIGLLSAAMAFALAALSPGPNMVAVASTGLAAGRRAATALASGIATGAFLWSLGMSYGLSKLFETFPWSLTLLSVAGGTYLLYLGCIAIRAALRGWASSITAGQQVSGAKAWLRGLTVTATNPKVALFWASIATFVTSLTTSNALLILFAVVVSVEALLIYGAYGFIFSSARARRMYERSQTAFEAGFGLAFGSLGLALLAVALNRAV